jgi:hypothetical protein
MATNPVSRRYVMQLHNANSTIIDSRYVAAISLLTAHHSSRWHTIFDQWKHDGMDQVSWIGPSGPMESYTKLIGTQGKIMTIIIAYQVCNKTQS